MTEALTNDRVVIILQMYQTKTPYTLNLHNVKCQLYLNKVGGGKDFLGGRGNHISGETFPHVLFYNCLNKFETVIYFFQFKFFMILLESNNCNGTP